MAKVAKNPKQLANKIIHDPVLVKATLSMKAFVYGALLMADKSYADYILQDIDQDYKYMLDCGATTFWETIEGEQDFDGAGSLCHGWSAIPIYYYHTLLSPLKILDINRGSKKNTLLKLNKKAFNSNES